ncbi:MAG: pyruvate, phosphate dikinase, partial [Oscillospiraceae bacterium]
MEKKYVYLFSEGDATMKNLLGGKGANLAEMTRLGFPVPQGFTVSTEACTKYYDDGQIINDEIQAQIYAALAKTEEIAGKNFGDVQNPFLVSVRSGARASMPGMMDTILNLGLNDEVVVGLANKTGNERFAYDSYRRFIQMFSDVVMELSKKKFEEIIDAMKNERGIKLDTEFTIDDLKEMVVKFKAFYKKEKGVDFPQDPKEQMLESIKAVFRSWDNPRANVYRRMNEIPYDWGTAVNVQAMVFGNMGETSGTGVAFTRDPSTGENVLYGEYLINAQGEDVVAGVRTPQHISKLEQDMPAVFKEFKEIAEKLEKHYRDMQDMEYTIEDGTLYMLQTRNGKRTAAAAIKVAVDLVEEGMITKEEAILQVDPKQLDALLHPTFVASALKSADVLTKGLAASPGAACGQVYFTADDCVEAVNDRGETVVLVRLETSPEDIEGMDAAQGVLTARGGMTSHAAVVARGMGTCCVAGCGDIKVDYDNGCFMVGSTKINKGDFISIDGSTGNVYIGKIDTESAKLTGDFEKFMSWADEIRTLKVRTNADTPKDAKQAREFGAEGIGLCRTEHMFFAEERIAA